MRKEFDAVIFENVVIKLREIFTDSEVYKLLLFISITFAEPTIYVE